MQFSDYMGLLGGLALFLYGMQMMSSGMEAAAGDRLKSILERLTANRFLGVFVGALITAIIQSSSATTVMVVGFVNSGMMTLRQAVWIIMGANIGTTITGQLIALDAGAVAPLIAFVGVVIFVFAKNERLHHVGNILAGLGTLFIGMDMMSSSMQPLQNSEAFIGLLTTFKNPILGILAGMIFTAIIQSSSASVGILQALAGSGIIGLDSAAFVLFGQNIGTCITAMLAAIGTSRNAKRTTIMHVTFNIIGTIIFTTLCIVTPLISFMQGLTPTNAPAQIANLHTLFNVVTTVILLPFGGYLARFAEFVLKDKGGEESGQHLEYIVPFPRASEEQLGISAINVDSVRREIQRMMGMAQENVALGLDIFLKKDTSQLDKLEKGEEYVDYLNKEISSYISRAAAGERTESGSAALYNFYKIVTNLERISDHAMNMGEYSLMLKKDRITYSDETEREIGEMKNICGELFRHLEQMPEDMNTGFKKVEELEEVIDDMTLRFRNGMFGRIREGICQDEGGVLYSELLTDFERVGDHALNIAEALKAIREAGEAA